MRNERRGSRKVADVHIPAGGTPCKSRLTRSRPREYRGGIGNRAGKRDRETGEELRCPENAAKRRSEVVNPASGPPSPSKSHTSGCDEIVSAVSPGGSVIGNPSASTPFARYARHCTPKDTIISGKPSRSMSAATGSPDGSAASGKDLNQSVESASDARRGKRPGDEKLRSGGQHKIVGAVPVEVGDDRAPDRSLGKPGGHRRFFGYAAHVDGAGFTDCGKKSPRAASDTIREVSLKAMDSIPATGREDRGTMKSDVPRKCRSMLLGWGREGGLRMTPAGRRVWRSCLRQGCRRRARGGFDVLPV